MKLHTKLILWLLGCLVVVVTAAQALQYYGAMKRLTLLSNSSEDILQTRELAHAQQVHSSVEAAVAGSLERGEMEKFTALVAQQNQVEGLLEFSLYDAEGRLTHSSKPDMIGKALRDDIKAKMASNPEKITDKTSDAIEIYEPHMATESCVRCHIHWQVGQLGGVTHFRFSTASIQKAKEDNKTAIASAKQATFGSAMLTLAGIVVVFVVAIYLLLTRFVRKPLGQFIALLGQFENDEGDLTRRIVIDSKDEIGALARLFNTFIEGLNKAIGRAQRAAVEVGQKTENQAAVVEETSASVKEIAEVTNQNAENARTVHALGYFIHERVDGSGVHGGTHVHDARTD